MTAPAVRMAIVDHDCSLDRALLADIAEMCSAVTCGEFARPAPYGWGVGAQVRLAAGPGDVGTDEWPVRLFSRPDVAGALGYHDATPDGRPELRVFPLIETPDDLPVTIFHEVVEALVDPSCALSAVGGDDIIRALEVADPVEADWFAFVCASGRRLRCSNWVLPSWFGGPVGPLDHMGLLHHPGELRPGGYIPTFDPRHGWSQQVAGLKREYRRTVGAAGRTRLAHRQARHTAGHR